MQQDQVLITVVWWGEDGGKPGVYMQEDQVLTAGVWWQKKWRSVIVSTCRKTRYWQLVPGGEVLTAGVWLGEDGGQPGGLNAERPGIDSWYLVSGGEKMVVSQGFYMQKDKLLTAGVWCEVGRKCWSAKVSTCRKTRY